MKIVDIKLMPKYNPVVKNGIDSVSSGKVILVTWYENRQTPSCTEHGAMNCVTDWDKNKGRIWRCLTCNEGGYEVSNG